MQKGRRGEQQSFCDAAFKARLTLNVLFGQRLRANGTTAAVLDAAQLQHI